MHPLWAGAWLFTPSKEDKPHHQSFKNNFSDRLSGVGGWAITQPLVSTKLGELSRFLLSPVSSWSMYQEFAYSEFGITHCSGWHPLPVAPLPLQHSQIKAMRAQGCWGEVSKWKIKKCLGIALRRGRFLFFCCFFFNLAKNSKLMEISCAVQALMEHYRQFRQFRKIQTRYESFTRTIFKMAEIRVSPSKTQSVVLAVTDFQWELTSLSFNFASFNSFFVKQDVFCHMLNFFCHAIFSLHIDLFNTSWKVSGEGLACFGVVGAPCSWPTHNNSFPRLGKVLLHCHFCRWVHNGTWNKFQDTQGNKTINFVC